MIKTSVSHFLVFLGRISVFCFLGFALLSTPSLYADVSQWTHFTIASPLPGEGWGTAGPALVDFDGDGDLDIALSRRSVQAAYWYERVDDSHWKQHTMGKSETLNDCLGSAVLDIDGDGWLDVALNRVWFKNPGILKQNPDAPWKANAYEGGGHDIAAADINGDGVNDIVANLGMDWFDVSQNLKKVPITEGLDFHGGMAPRGVGDIDGDGDNDVIMPGLWFENPGQGYGEWKRHEWPHVLIPNASYGTSARSWIADLNGDGRNDIVYSDCDTGLSHVYWVENLGKGDKWERHPLPDPPTNPGDVAGTGSFHSLGIADVDHDGDLDIFAGEQEDPDDYMASGGKLPMRPKGLKERGVIWENRGSVAQPAFVPVVIHVDNPGWHDAQLGDVDGDGDIDIVTKIWHSDGGPYHADFWRNDNVRPLDNPLCLYVSWKGNDEWTGLCSEPNGARTDGPFASLERARDEIRKRKKSGMQQNRGVKVIVQGGTYNLGKPFALEMEDSGTKAAPIVYESQAGETVCLSGGKTVSGFTLVEDEETLALLDKKARGSVWQADLKACGIADFGPADEGGAEVFFHDLPMTLARWPNEGFVRIVDIVEKDGHQIHGNLGSKTGKFVYEGDRPKRWLKEEDPWLHGYWFWDWSDQRQRIASIDADNSIIALKEPNHGYGYRKGQWYYAFNMLSELDAPGEWYIDREKGVLYFWPPEPIDQAKTAISVLPNLIVAKNASYVEFRGFVLEACRGTAISITGGEGDRLAECFIRNAGGSGAQLSGRDQVVEDCEIYQTGSGGISLSGGDRATLQPGRLYADNNRIHDYGRIKRMYSAGISLSGVGNHATHNLIYSAPHIAIIFGGNGHLLEFNEIHHVCMESNDAGAIYAGRDWTMRGNIIRHNYLHQITGFENRGCVGVYLDDMFASAAIYGNLFYQVTRAAFLGGGRDCTVENNIFADCNPALHVDARALGWAAYHADDWIKEAQKKGTLLGIAYTKPPYSERYLRLPNILNDNPKAPVGNLIARNICWGGKWDDIEKKALPFLTIEDNLINEDPHFVNAENLDFRLQYDSPAYKLGFKTIPMEEIGLRKKTDCACKDKK
ncbi:MAG: FG-GAP-like repeat-containing protein [Candidatus Omnitrophota bacterium]